MPLLQWDQIMSVGVPTIDEQHKVLIGIMNDLYDGMMSGKSRAALGDALTRLKKYTLEHFAYEEELFEATNYKYTDEHKQEHKDLIKKVDALMKEYDNTVSGIMAIEALGFLKSWATNHIMVEDKKYSEHFKAAGVR